ncbi:MAG: UDP-N-acetylmuramoyl-tripeptide--D-alanyl-D-alanine ligase, partial [Novosphingobium sp.]
PAITMDGVPTLLTESPQQAVMDLARYARDHFTGRVIGVTGSAGKTTMVAMMAAALRPFGLVGQTGHNANLPLGVAWNLASMRWTDPHIVVELSIGRMAQSARLARPNLAIFTNILPAHLEHHRSVQQVARLKSRVFLGMERDSVAILNRDMDQWEIVHDAAVARGLNIMHYGTHQDCDVRLVDYDPGNNRVRANIGGAPVTYRLDSPGEHMAINSLAVIAAARSLGHPFEPVVEAIGTFSPLVGRGAQFECCPDGHSITVIDEAYNANPGSMRAALSLLGGMKNASRRVAVLGEMAELGPGAQSYHTDLVPLITANRIDRVHVVGELYSDFWKALPDHVRGSSSSSLRELEGDLRRDLKDGDCVLLKGSHSTGLHKLVERFRRVQGQPVIA